MSLIGCMTKYLTVHSNGAAKQVLNKNIEKTARKVIRVIVNDFECIRYMLASCLFNSNFILVYCKLIN